MARIDRYRDGKWVSTLELLQHRTYLIGRDPQADLVLEDPLCSRHHLHIDWVGGTFNMKDLDTSNGTTVDGVREYNLRLSKNATIQIGKDMLLFQPEPDDADLSPDDTLPPWAFRSLEAPAQGMPETGMMAPAALQRLQARTRLRTHPHLVRRIPGSDPEIHPLDLDVTLIGYGATRVSLGAGKDKTLAGVHKTNSAYRIKAKGLFGRIVINGASKREAVLKSRDRIEVDGVLFEFHPGLEGEGE